MSTTDQPHPATFPWPTPTHPSLTALPPDNELRKIYPIDIYPNPQAAKLPFGETTYWLLGPEHGPKLVLIHGISTPSNAFYHVVPDLVDLGFRVLIYDLCGRGYTEAPADPTIRYDANLYIIQLALLFQHVGFDKAIPVGYSMGGGVAAAFAAAFPNLVNGKVVLIASAGLMDPIRPGLTFPPAESFENGKAPITALPPSFHNPLVKLQLEYLPGYYRALTSSIISGPIRDLDNAFKTIATQENVKVLLIHGNKDSVVPLRAGQRIKDLISFAEFVIIEGAEHDLVVSPNNVGHKEFKESLVKFLQS